jgi:hypothetical protein
MPQESRVTAKTARYIKLGGGGGWEALCLKEGTMRLYYQHEKATGAHIVCGRVNAKNSFGGYKGFERFVSDARAVNVLENDMKSSAEFNIVWNKLCL